jgi:hypothetical protein
MHVYLGRAKKEQLFGVEVESWQTWIFGLFFLK